MRKIRSITKSIYLPENHDLQGLEPKCCLCGHEYQRYPHEGIWYVGPKAHFCLDCWANNRGTRKNPKGGQAPFTLSKKLHQAIDACYEESKP